MARPRCWTCRPSGLGLPCKHFADPSRRVKVPASLANALKALSKREGVSLFMTLLAAFQVLLYRYSGQQDITVGSPIANRNRSGLEALIGLFVNTLPLRVDLSGNPTFRQLLARTREVVLGAYENQDIPFDALVKDLQPERNLSYSPLFQVLFALQNAPPETREPRRSKRVRVKCHIQVRSVTLHEGVFRRHRS